MLRRREKNKMPEQIKKRVKELEKEVEDHKIKLQQYNQALNQLQTSIISKNGAIIELRKLINKKEG